MENKFEYTDELAKDKFFSYCNAQPWCKVNKRSKPGFAVWDVSFTSGDTNGNTINFIGEIKDRLKPSTYSTNWYYEEKKHNDLKEIKDKVQLPTKIAYINFFTDDKIWIWDTTSVEEFKKPIPQAMKKQTMGNDKLITKSVYLMNKQETIIKDIL